ncbi:MAG: hypothetical protein J1E36_03420 [Eubacterium sp.]|nr:hypothetical protein [Eubacterium sp.]
MSKNNKKSDIIEKKCFIITPIGEPGSKVRRHMNGIIDEAIIPVLEVGVNGIIYKEDVAHRLYDSTAIVKQIYEKLYEDDLVIANLTGLNPNVMYELAIRFCIGKPVIVIAEEDTVLPFDVKDHRTIFYINDAQGIKELKENLVNALKTIDYNDDEPISPVHDAIRDFKFINSLKNNDIGDDKDKTIFMILEKLNKIEYKLTMDQHGYSRKNENKYALHNDFPNTRISDIINDLEKSIENIENEYELNYNKIELYDKVNIINRELFNYPLSVRDNYLGIILELKQRIDRL